MVLHPISSGVLYGYPLVIAFQIYTFFIIPSNVTSYVILSSTPALFLSKQYAGYSLPLSLYTTIYVFTTTSPFFNNLPQSPLEYKFFLSIFANVVNVIAFNVHTIIVKIIINFVIILFIFILLFIYNFTACIYLRYSGSSSKHVINVNLS